MAATTKKPARLTAKQQKTVDKVRDVLEAYPLGISLDDLIKEANPTAWATQQALSLVGASMRYDGLWQLPGSKTSSAPIKADDAPSAEPVQDDNDNGQAPQVSSPVSAIDTDSDRQETIEVGEIIASSDDFLDPELPSAELVHQATYLVIENCFLSLAQDGTGQEPVLAKDVWVDDEGDELEEADCQVMNRARQPCSNEVEFRGVTYRNLFIVNNAQIFHGVFNSIKAAHDHMAELMAKKPSNFFEVIEV